MPAHAIKAALPVEPPSTPKLARYRSGAPRGRLFCEVGPGEILFRTDLASQLRSIIVVDAVIPGPALGGCTLIANADESGALGFALQRARSATRQAALADLPFGGGHAVLIAPAGPFDRSAFFNSFGQAVGLAKGRFIATEDTGCDASDMRAARTRTQFVSGAATSSILTSSPAPASALGLFLAIESALHRMRMRLKRATVAVHGLDATALALCERLREAGARLVIADVDPTHAEDASRRFDATIVGEHEFAGTHCDVLVPCSRRISRFVERSTRLQASLVCGTSADLLLDGLNAEDGTWLPDDLVACGGLVCNTRKFLQPSIGSQVVEEIARIRQRVHEFIERCAGRQSQAVADDWIAEKLAGRAAWTGWQTTP